MVPDPLQYVPIHGRDNRLQTIRIFRHPGDPEGGLQTRAQRDDSYYSECAKPQFCTGYARVYDLVRVGRTAQPSCSSWKDSTQPLSLGASWTCNVDLDANLYTHLPAFFPEFRAAACARQTNHRNKYLILQRPDRTAAAEAADRGQMMRQAFWCAPTTDHP